MVAPRLLSRRALCAAVAFVSISTAQNAAASTAVSSGLPAVEQQATAAQDGMSMIEMAQTIGRRLATDEYKGASKDIEEFKWWQLFLVCCLVLTLGALAAGAGIGGGGLFVPIYWLILGVGPKAAVPLSKATILGGAIGNFVSIGRARHPKADRPMIDYEASTFMQSGELLGVIFGVLLNMLLPSVFIIVFLVMILSYNALRTFRKGFAARKKEDAAAAAAKGFPDEKKTETKEGMTVVSVDSVEVKEDAGDEKEGAPDTTDHATSANAPDPTPSTAEATAPSEAAQDALEAGTAAKPVADLLQAILDGDKKQFPLWAWGLLVPMTIYTIIYAVLKKQVFSLCNPGLYWFWYMTPVPILGGFMYGTALLLKKRHINRVQAGFEYLPEDIQWTAEMLKKFPVTALMAGVTAGLLGIGGGMVIGPLFLAIGMQPQVGTSSCSFMILFTALSGVVQYVSQDKLGWQLMLFCIGIGFVSGQLGQRLVNKVIKKTGRPSYVIFLLAAIIGAACVSMTISGIAKIALDIVDGDTAADIFRFSTDDFKCND